MKGNRLTAVVTSFGATLLSVKHEVNGKLEEVTLNHSDFAKLIDKSVNPKYGATCGRTAGRINNGQFTLLDLNEASPTFKTPIPF
jgi:galactose mutarotase-like enzyme